MSRLKTNFHLKKQYGKIALKFLGDLKTMKRQKHILIEYATSYERLNRELTPEGCHYDFEIGAWVVSDTGRLLVESPERPKPQTKKHDIETGEDQKGE
jgi:hypothetical protein